MSPTFANESFEMLPVELGKVDDVFVRHEERACEPRISGIWRVDCFGRC